MKVERLERERRNKADSEPQKSSPTQNSQADAYIANNEGETRAEELDEDMQRAVNEGYPHV